MKSKKCIVFTRVVVINLDRVNKVILQGAHEQITNLIAAHFGLEIVERFEQDVNSSPKGEQAQLGKALEFCKANPDVKYLVAADPDRISRDLATFRHWKKQFADQGVRIVTLHTKTLDKESEAEQLALEAGFTLEAHSSQAKSERIRRRMLDKVKSGLSVTRTPLGYVPTAKTGLYRPNKLGRKMKNVFEAVLDDELTIEEAVEALSNLVEVYRHIKLDHSRLVKVIRNPYYAGYIAWNGEKYKGQHEALISPEDHDYLVRLLKEAFKRG